MNPKQNLKLFRFDFSGGGGGDVFLLFEPHPKYSCLKIASAYPLAYIPELFQGQTSEYCSRRVFISNVQKCI